VGIGEVETEVSGTRQVPLDLDVLGVGEAVGAHQSALRSAREFGLAVRELCEAIAVAARATCDDMGRDGHGVIPHDSALATLRRGEGRRATCRRPRPTT